MRRCAAWLTALVGVCGWEVERTVFPQHHPDVCVCVLSLNRLDLLERTLRSTIEHLEADEPLLRYELVWVDNGSDPAAVARFLPRFQIEKRLLLGVNYGVAYGFNSLFHDLCRAPYVLSLEEDWEWIDPVSAHLSARYAHRRLALTLAIELLRSPAAEEGRIASVVLKDESFERYAADDTFGWRTTGAGGVRFRRFCMNISTGWVWGSYTNGAVLMDRQKLLEIGRMYGEPSETSGFPHAYSEGNYAFRMGLRFCSAMMELVAGCEQLACNAAWRHISTDARSHGITREYEQPGQQEQHWLLYGTPHFDLNQQASAGTAAKTPPPGGRSQKTRTK